VLADCEAGVVWQEIFIASGASQDRKPGDADVHAGNVLMKIRERQIERLAAVVAIKSLHVA
jgi:hypothetical protein